MNLNARSYASAPAAALMLLIVTGCASTFDVLPEKMGGLPESAPARPAEAYTFPNVYQSRPTRDAKPLDETEQKKLESDLVTLREQQKSLANPPPPQQQQQQQQKAAAKPPSKTPAKAATPKKEAAKTAETKKKEPVVPEAPSAPPKPLN
jgi:outer membrane biosynthesis protein TonB